MDGSFDRDDKSARPAWVGSGSHGSEASGGKCPFAFVPCLDRSERMVALGFRHWVAGYHTGDVACWEQAWLVFEQELGSAAARHAVTDLGCWVRTIVHESHRPIEVFPGPCRGYCRDECLALCMVAAAQHGAHDLLPACAATLLGSPRASCDVCRDARSFARSLTRLGCELSDDRVRVLQQPPRDEYVRADEAGGRDPQETAIPSEA